MRKIISILIGLGLVLAFSAVAMPTMAVTCGATVTVTPPCAGQGAIYCVTFTAPFTLLPVNDRLSVDFGAGTTFAPTFTAADITVNGKVTTSVAVSGTHIDFPIPAGAGTISPDATVTVCVADVVNPAVGGVYQLGLNYKLACCPAAVFGCASYTITISPATWYVVEGGAGAQNGANWGNAFATIQEAINVACAGDMVRVAAGTYAAFQVMGKDNIHIISAEGATVATTKLYTALPVVGNAWVLAAVYNSTNINIEGINFDGTGVTGKPVVVGIAYVHSTGRIADLTAENVIATSLGAGVAIIGHAGTSAVEMTRATISSNDNAGIYVCGGSTLDAHFNKIAGNAECGLWNDGGGMVDATYNWWGDASGPLHQTNPLGRGNAIIGDADFKPWLVGEIVTKTVKDGIVDAITEANTEVVVKGTARVIVARYSSNPYLTLSSYAAADSPDLTELDMYVDVAVLEFEPETRVEPRLYYTGAEVEGFDETSLQLFWLNGTKWEACSSTGVNTTDITKDNRPYSGYMWAEIRETGTTPTLSQLTETPFGGYGHPTEVNNCCSASVAAASGTNVAQKLNLLREFRDEVMLPNALSAELVSFYYGSSPPIACFISQHDVLTRLVRLALFDPIVKILNWTHDLWSANGLWP